MTIDMTPIRSLRCWSIVYALVLAIVAVGSPSCVPPRSVKQVKQTREGRALGDRLCVVYSGRYQINFGGLEKLHPFDIQKYVKIYQQLVREGLLAPADVFVPEEASRAQLLTVHTPAYLRDLRDSAKLARYVEFGALSFSPTALNDAAMLQPFRFATGGTILAARLALKHGMAINLGGGYHHAEPDRGGGFCIYADMPIAIRVLQSEGLIRRALIVDVDVHQGNGTAKCIADDPDVFTLDLHERDIYPMPKEKNDLDVPLPAGTTDAEYLKVLAKHLPSAFDTARPDIVFVQAGVDGLAGDPLAHFELTAEGIRQRDAMIFAEAHRRGVPVVMVLGGGYSPQAWRVQFESIRSLIATYGTTPGASRQDQAVRPPMKKSKR